MVHPPVAAYTQPTVLRALVLSRPGNRPVCCALQGAPNQGRALPLGLFLLLLLVLLPTEGATSYGNRFQSARGGPAPCPWATTLEMALVVL